MSLIRAQNQWSRGGESNPDRLFTKQARSKALAEIAWCLVGCGRSCRAAEHGSLQGQMQGHGA